MGCAPGDFVCGDQSCIPGEWECDNLADCSDGSDEAPVNPTCPGGPDVPPGWTCDPGYYGTTDGCDCGCGALDPDCFTANVADCEYCADSGSCSLSDCPGTINPINNAVCN
jgi:hypothetical protein